MQTGGEVDFAASLFVFLKGLPYFIDSNPAE
jgi:hypothetical protein